MNPNLYQSIKYFEQALNVYTPDLFPQQASETYINLGYAYLQSGQFNEANNAFVKSSQIYTNLSACRKWADIQLKIGFALHQTSNIDCLRAAISYFSASTHIFQLLKLSDGYLISLLNLGLTYKKIGFFDLAFQTLEKVVQTIDFDKKTLESMQEATQVFIEKTSRKPSNLQSFKSDTNGLINELISEETTIDTVDFLQVDMGLKSARSPNLRESTHQLYQSIVEICLNLGNWEKAIEYTDRSKARNLVELMATRDAYPGGVIPDDIHQQLQSLKTAISQEDRRLQQEENPDYTHLNQLRQQKRELEPYKPLHFQGMQELLDKETAILEWYILGDKFLTFTLTAQTLNLWTSSKEDLDKLIDWTNTYINDYRRLKSDQWRDILPQHLEQLPKILHLDEILANLRQQLPNCQKLILIPHRFLHLFPLHALPIPTEDDQGHLLQDLFPKGVGYAPNCQVLQQSQKRINQRLDFNHLFAIQNPTQDLHFTDMEVEAIQSLFNPHQVVLKHDQAEKADIDAETLKNANCVHFSCHGYFNFEYALKSALILAKSEFTPPPPTDDPSRYLSLEDNKLLDLQKCLTLEDILRLDLSNCRLVTLSACETGITDITSSSDEYIGLPSGFILAGSPNVVSTLWAVNDLSTAIFMIQFYQTLQQQPELSVVLALRQTQTWLREATVQDLLDWVDGCAVISPERRKQMQKRLTFGAWKNKLDAKRFESPYYWAAFCAIGA